MCCEFKKHLFVKGRMVECAIQPTKEIKSKISEANLDGYGK